MALIHIDGFDHYGDDETNMTDGVYEQVGSAFSLSTTNKRTGNRCIRRDSTSVESDLTKGFDSGRDIIGFGLAFSIDQLPAVSNSYIISHLDDQNGSEQIVFFLGLNGEVYATLSDKTTMIATSQDNVVTPGSYVHFEVGVVVDGGVSLLEGTGDIDNLRYFDENLSATETDSISDAFIGNGDTSLYLLDNTPNVIFQYDLSVPGDVTTASYTGKSFSTSSEVGANNNHSITFGNGGTKLYITEASNAPLTTHQYTLSTAWDISTASYDGISFTSSEDAAMYAVQFNSDGTIMVGVGDVNSAIFEYSLSEPWNIATATYNSVSFDISPELTDAHNIRFNSTGTRIYTLGVSGNTIYQYNLSTAYDISSASFSDKTFSAVETSDTHGFCFNSAMSKAYVADLSSDTLFQYSFPLIVTSDSGILEVRINGATVISVTDTKTRSNNNDNYHKVSLSFGSASAHGVTTDIDDFFIWDAAGGWNNTFLGDRRCFFLKPNQDTNISDFEPSSGSFGYKMIDDDSPDDDSSYIIAEAYLQTGSPLSGESEFLFDNLPNGASLISGVQLSTRASKTDNTSAEIFTSITSGSDSLSLDSHTLTTTYKYYNDIYEYDPSTISSFTKDAINNLSISITADDLDSVADITSPEDSVSPVDFVSPEDFVSPNGFDPSELFAGGEEGGWYDPSDLSTLWQDTAATIPVTSAGQSVARMDDKSGNGNHMTQGTSSLRPTYETDGTLRWLQFDGTDDYMTSSLIAGNVLESGFYVSSASKNDSSSDIGVTLGERTSASAALRCHIYNDTRTQKRMFLYAPDGTNRFIDLDSQLDTNAHVHAIQGVGTTITGYLDGTAQASTITTSAVFTSASFLIIGDDQNSSVGELDGSFYGGVAVDRSLTDSERSDVLSYLSGKAGI